MSRHQIPTARYRTFTADEFEEARMYLCEMKPPYVIKADGLAAGKGVLICDSISEAYRELEELLLKRRFGNSCNKVVIEEFLEGSELSVFVITDGTHWKLLPEAKTINALVMETKDQTPVEWVLFPRLISPMRNLCRKLSTASYSPPLMD